VLDQECTFLVQNGQTQCPSGRRHPQACRQVLFVFQDLAGSTEVADVGHARTDEDFCMAPLNPHKMMHSDA
jgi:Fe-S-cluster containining protein